MDSGGAGMWTMIGILLPIIGLLMTPIGTAALLFLWPEASRPAIVAFVTAWMWTYAYWGTLVHARYIELLFTRGKK